VKKTLKMGAFGLREKAEGHGVFAGGEERKRGMSGASRETI